MAQDSLGALCADEFESDLEAADMGPHGFGEREARVHARACRAPRKMGLAVSFIRRDGLPGAPSNRLPPTRRRRSETVGNAAAARAAQRNTSTAEQHAEQNGEKHQADRAAA